MLIKWAYFFDWGTFELNFPVHRIGMAQGPGILVQSLFYLITSMVLVMEHMRMFVEFRISDNGPKKTTLICIYLISIYIIFKTGLSYHFSQEPLYQS